MPFLLLLWVKFWTKGQVCYNARERLMGQVMNFFFHMSLVVVLDYVIFMYWYAIANRYEVLNFHETGYLPARYIISGLVAGAFIYWVYLIPVALRTRFSRRYQHPRWWMLWIAVTFITSLQVGSTVIKQASPPLDIETTVALVIHLELIHLMMFLIANLAAKQPVRILIPGMRPGVLFMGMWLFWIWYSFAVKPEGDNGPMVGAAWERYVLAMILIILIWIALIYLWGLNFPGLRPNRIVIEPAKITIIEILKGFYSAWALFYLTVPVIHYFLRGYVIAHSNVFTAFLPGILVPLVWSLILMWPLIWLMRPDPFHIKIRLPRPTFERR